MDLGHFWPRGAALLTNNGQNKNFSAVSKIDLLATLWALIIDGDLEKMIRLHYGKS
jgi:hypothetical protein